MRPWDRVFADSLISKERTKFRRCAKDFHSLNPREKKIRGTARWKHRAGGGGGRERVVWEGKKCTCCRFTPMHNKAACYRAKNHGSSDGSSRSLYFRVWWTFLFRRAAEKLAAEIISPFYARRHAARSALPDIHFVIYMIRKVEITWRMAPLSRGRRARKTGRETTVFPGSFFRSLLTIKPDPVDPFCSARVLRETRDANFRNRI